MKIPMPSPDEKRRSIDIILQSVPETQESFIKTARDMLRLLGLRGLFFGVGDAAFIALMSAVILSTFVFTSIKPGGVLDDTFYGTLFFLSPLTYILLYGLTAWKERIAGVWEINSTYRFTPRHLTAVRMFCFGGSGTAMCAVLSLVLALCSEAEFFRLLGLTLCSLFLFAALFMLLMIKLRGLWTQGVCAVLWCTLGIVLNTDEGVFMKGVLDGLPIAVLYIAAASFLALFIVETRTYFLDKGENGYVVG